MKPYLMTYYQDGESFHCRLVRETDQTDFETGKPIYDHIARAWLNQAELDLFIMFCEALNAKVEKLDPAPEGSWHAA